MASDFKKIICPACQAEYLPCEIYLPNHFLGKATDIEREHVSGKIIDYFGTPMDNHETYVCDRCGTPFEITATIKFYTKEIDRIDFGKAYKTNIKKPILSLDED